MLSKVPARGVGSVFDLSYARVAKLLGAKVVIVSREDWQADR